MRLTVMADINFLSFCVLFYPSVEEEPQRKKKKIPSRFEIDAEKVLKDAARKSVEK